jgi:hypothetical protein
MSLYEHIRCVEGTVKTRQDVENEVIDSNVQDQRQVLLDASPWRNSAPQLYFEEDQIREVEVIPTVFGEFRVPIPKAEYTSGWDDILCQHQNDIQQQLEQINEFQNQQFSIAKIVKKCLKFALAI